MMRLGAPRAGVAASTALLVLAGVAPATARADGALPGTMREQRIPGLERALRGGLGDAVRTVATMAEISLPEPPRPTSVASPSRLSAELRAPVEGLLGALAETEAIASTAILDPSGAMSALPTVERDLVAATATAARSTQAPIEDGAVRFMSQQAFERIADRIRALEARLPRLVDREALHLAATVLAAGIDEHLPALRDATRGRVAESRAPCDIARHEQLLCVSSEGAQTHTEDFRLSIDLGGDDVYTSSAGSAVLYTAGPIGPDEISDRAVSVLIDVAGDDRYVHEKDSTHPDGRWGAQGSGMLGGVGALVDVTGNDTYTATTTAPGQTTTAQGYGVAGVGMLADLEGDDSYAIDDPFQEKIGATDVNSTSAATGQGRAILGGVAITLDRGRGSDRYDVRSTPSATIFPDDWLEPAQATAAAFGVSGLGGAALHADDGGADDYTVLAQAGTVAPDDVRPIRAGWGSTSAFGVTVFGGAALAISGEGETRRSVISRASAPAVQLTHVNAFGGGGFGSHGALHDLGGDDAYVAEAIAEAERRGILDDSCACSQYEFRAYSAPYQGSIVRSHGGLALVGGDTGNGAVLQDRGGDDRYVARAVATSRVVAHDRRERPVAPEAGGDPLIAGLAVSGAAFTQSHGSGFSNGAAATLVDDAGDDAYVAEAINDAEAAVTADHPEVARMGRAWRNRVDTLSLGYGGFGGTGYFFDRDGADRYTVTARGVASASPASELIDTPPTLQSLAAVDVFGVASFVDDGPQADTLALTPPRPPCHGTRGEQVWVDCSASGAAVGTNLDAGVADPRRR